METIEQMQFDSIDMTDFWTDNGVRAHRLTGMDLAEMPDDTRNLDELKVKLYEHFHEKLENYSKLELSCDIKRDTFQKMIRFTRNTTVKITYTTLAKFSVGAGLNEVEAKELFLLMGHELSERNRCDYILLHELRNRGSLSDYNEDMIRFGYGSIISKAD